MYRQYDGYLSGHGIELATFLHGMRIVNGLGIERKHIANGAGCLAAQIVAHFKTAPGDVYIESIPNSPEDLEEVDYVYNVMVDSGEITVTVVGGEIGFSGTVPEFFEYCKA
jgi:hypothetical protein